MFNFDTTYSTKSCAICGGSHKHIKPTRPFDVNEVYILCPTSRSPIYDFTTTWTKDSNLEIILDKISFKWVLRVSLVPAILSTIMIGCPHYKVWTSEMQGRAKLAEATYGKQVAVQEAEAKKDAATKLAEADILRAKGEATANQIIGDSLKNNEARLRYLWITSLHDNPNNQVIYVPTEAGLPILEAMRKVK